MSELSETVDATGVRQEVTEFGGESRTAHYKGDRTGIIDALDPMGPDTRGAYWKPTSAAYDGVADTTTVVFDGPYWWEPDIPASLKSKGIQ